MMTSCVGLRKAKKVAGPSPPPYVLPPGGNPGTADSTTRPQSKSIPPRADTGYSSTTSSTDSKENAENTTPGQHSGTTTSTSTNTNTNNSSNSNGWLARVCSKLRGNRLPRVEKCQKCGEKSDTCQPTDSFVSGRKVFLCEGCRGAVTSAFSSSSSSDKMKGGMYDQLWRSLSVHDPPRPVGRRVCDVGGGEGDILAAASAGAASSSARSRGVMRAKSMRNPRPAPAAAAPDSGYDTATSLDSSCSNGRLSPEPVVTGVTVAGGECCRGPGECRGVDLIRSPEHTPLREIQAGPHTRVYTRPPPPYRPRQTPPPPPCPASHHYYHPHHHHQYPPPHHHHHHQTPLSCRDKDVAGTTTNNYDGFLEIRAPNSDSVKYVFRPRRENCDQRTGVSDNVPPPPPPPPHQHQHQHHQGGGDSGKGCEEKLKRCYRCHQFRQIAFRAPFGNGWLCEDCSDDLM